MHNTQNSRLYRNYIITCWADWIFNDEKTIIIEGYNMTKEKIRIVLFFTSIVIGFVIVFIQINKIKERDLFSENIPHIYNHLITLDNSKEEYEKLKLWSTDANNITETFAYKLINERYRKAKLELGKHKDRLLISNGNGVLIHSIKSENVNPVEVRLHDDYTFDAKLEILVNALCKKLGNVDIKGFVENDLFDLRNELDILLATELNNSRANGIDHNDIVLIIIPSILSFVGLLTWVTPLKSSVES